MTIFSRLGSYLSRRDLFRSSEAKAHRRQFLLGLGAGGLALSALDDPAAAATPTGLPGVTRTADAENAGGMKPFRGDHQSGILDERPQFGMVVAFDCLAQDRRALERLFRVLTERIEFLTRGGTPPELDSKFPPLDSGILGPVVVPRNLTITVSVGVSLFDERYGLERLKPVHLTAMPHFPNDALVDDMCHGDLLLQICSDAADVNLHALRDVIKHTAALLSVRWKQEGFLPNVNDASKSGETSRNLLGFKDGTANPSASDSDAMERIVWVRAGSEEPAWTVNGTYQVVRIIRTLVERWDRTALQEQQTIIGRSKMSGAPLGKAREADDPDYGSDPKGERIPLDAHIRLANPRTAESNANLIFRRPYNYSRGVDRAGQLDMGLLFICYQSNLRDGFLAVQKRLDGEPLEEYIKPFAGGFFFALPGVREGSGWLGDSLFESALKS